MGQSDLDPQTIDLNLNLRDSVPIRVCCTGRETKLWDNNSSLERVLHIDER